ncbi:hypothetical protein JOJ88_002718 [Pantoea cypripedii]|nr:hypothetical protein [Pantoea cypripedii]
MSREGRNNVRADEVKHPPGRVSASSVENAAQGVQIHE